MPWCRNWWIISPKSSKVADTSGQALGENGFVRAIGLTLLAYLLFASVDTSTKWLVGSGLAALQLAFMRYLVHFAITVVDVRRAAADALPLTLRLKTLVAVRALSLVSSTVANFIALGHLDLAVTSALLFLSPVVVCLLAIPILGERIGTLHWLAIALGFAGVVLIVDPFGEAINWYAVLMLYPACGMALYAVLTRLLAGQVSAARMQFQTGLLGTVALAPLGLWTWRMPETALDTALLIAIGAIAWAGHEALTRAHALARASDLAPMGYSFVIYLTLAGWLVFGEVPERQVIWGGLAIILSGHMIWRLRKRA